MSAIDCLPMTNISCHRCGSKGLEQSDMELCGLLGDECSRYLPSPEMLKRAQSSARYFRRRIRQLEGQRRTGGQMYAWALENRDRWQAEVERCKNVLDGRKAEAYFWKQIKGR